MKIKPLRKKEISLYAVAVFLAGIFSPVSCADEVKARPVASELAFLNDLNRLEEIRPRVETPTTKALKTYLSLKNRQDKVFQEDLGWLKDNAKMAGRIYATMLLARISKEPVGRALQDLAETSGSTNVEVLSAGSSCHYNVSDIAVDQSSKAPILKLLPDMP